MDKVFAIVLSACLTIFAVLYIIVDYVQDIPLASWKFWLLLAYFGAMALIAQLILKRSANKRPQAFPGVYMMTTGLKLISAVLIFILVALMSAKEEVLPFGIAFIVLYISFHILISWSAMRIKPGQNG